MRTILLVLIILVATGCNEKKKDYCNIDLQNTHVSNFSDFKIEKGRSVLGEQYFIPMETDTNNLLGEVKKIATNQEYIFVSDNQKVICYEPDENLQKGTIRYTINNMGKGPAEYYNIEDFALNNRYLFIYDVHKVNFYDIRTGKFIRSINLNFAAREMDALTNHLVFYASSFQNSPEYNYEIIILSLDGKKVYKYFKNNKGYLGSVDGRQLCKINNDLFYCCLYRNTVYKFNTEAAPIPFLVLAADSENNIYDLTTKDAIKNQDDLKTSNYNYYFTKFQKLNNYWSIQFCNKGNFYSAFINSKDYDSGYIASTGYIPQTVFQKYVISPVDSWNISKFDPLVFKDDTAALKMYSRVLDVNENDNPCLLIQEIL